MLCPGRILNGVGIVEDPLAHTLRARQIIIQQVLIKWQPFGQPLDLIQQQRSSVVLKIAVGRFNFYFFVFGWGEN